MSSYAAYLARAAAGLGGGAAAAAAAAAVASGAPLALPGVSLRPELKVMARLALSQPEPRGWSAQLDPLGRPFFVHAATSQSVGTHPIDAVYASLWRAYEQLAPPPAAPPATHDAWRRSPPAEMILAVARRPIDEENGALVPTALAAAGAAAAAAPAHSAPLPPPPVELLLRRASSTEWDELSRGTFASAPPPKVQKGHRRRSILAKALTGGRAPAVVRASRGRTDSGASAGGAAPPQPAMAPNYPAAPTSSPSKQTLVSSPSGRLNMHAAASDASAALEMLESSYGATSLSEGEDPRVLLSNAAPWGRPPPMICCELVEDYDDARDNGRPKSCELHVRDREGGAYPLLVASRLLDLSQVPPTRPPPHPPGTHPLSLSLLTPDHSPQTHRGARPPPHAPHTALPP